MAQLRRKDTEGTPANGGQFAGQAHTAADDVALNSENFAWPNVDGAGTEPAFIDYGNDQRCVCSNTNHGDGFVTTDEHGQLHDDETTAHGVICLVCGRFYRIEPGATTPPDIVPAARFDVSAPAFLDAYDEQWERLHG
ncbi:hypothetical protein [Curtobacterium sp. MCBD17_040]|uniref:hypothetical protein n=1 Tax=Curtobacterium sp. MCBD17_040 TaxID=2175674 RepID=UPI000DAA2EEF|nr:hypothetical protein [Curtobacterium sp. MCBD17_040]WIB65605.1 hypothetical protein DEI94_15920 [Curtobacterium sp. MCBD17_040]